MIPEYDRPYHIDLKKLKKGFYNLLNAVDQIGMVRILGGEPLMNPYIDEIVEFVSRSDKVLNVHIVTNGTIVPNDRLVKNRRTIKVSFLLATMESCLLKREKL